MDINNIIIKFWLFPKDSIDIDCYNTIKNLYYKLLKLKEFRIPPYNTFKYSSFYFSLGEIFEMNGVIIKPIKSKHSFKLRNGPFKNTTNPYCLFNDNFVIYYCVPNTHYIDRFSLEFSNDYYLYKYNLRDGQLYDIVIYYK